jgi:hypothetical protein
MKRSADARCLFPPKCPVRFNGRGHFVAGWLEHDPEKWKPVFRKDHAQTKDEIMIRFNLIES